LRVENFVTDNTFSATIAWPVCFFCYAVYRANVVMLFHYIQAYRVVIFQVWLSDVQNGNAAKQQKLNSSAATIYEEEYRTNRTIALIPVIVSAVETK